MNTNKFLPPKELPDYPIVITPQIFDDDAIKTNLERILKNPKLDTLVAVAPFVSPYFSKFLANTNVKNLVLLINRESFNPEYVKDAIEKLKETKFKVTIRERPENSKFIHMKLMIPYVKIERTVTQYGKQRVEISLVPMCAICGSVNFTKNGIEKSDEMLVILRDMYSINALETTYDVLVKESIIRFPK